MTANQVLKMCKQLGEIAERAGYKWWQENGGAHIKFCFGDEEHKRFLVLSHSGAYHGGTALSHMATRMRRLMTELPPPKPANRDNVKITPAMAKAIDKAASGEVKLPTTEPTLTVVEAQRPDNTYKDPSEKSPVSWPMRLTVGGRGEGGLTIAFPVGVREFFPGCDYCDLIYVEGRSIGIAFRQKGQAKIGGVRGGKDCMVYFARADLPFGLTQGSVQDRIFGKATGDALVSTIPTPKQILAGFAPVKGADLAADGIAAKKLLNEWLLRAKAAGMEPEVSFHKDNCTISINIAEKRKVSL